MPAIRYRLRFAKSGDLIWVSHGDFLRLLGRCARVARLPLTWTQGFNPRPHIHIGLALAVGVAGEAEVLEVGCAEAIDPAQLRDRWQAALPAGITLGEVTVAPSRAAVQVVGAHYRITWATPPVTDLRDRAHALLLARTAVVERRLAAGTKPVDVRRWLEGCAAVRDRELRLALRVDNGTARPDEVLRALGLDEAAIHAADLVRTRLRLRDS